MAGARYFVNKDNHRIFICALFRIWTAASLDIGLEYNLLLDFSL